MAKRRLDYLRAVKNDEFYTELPYIEQEISAYVEHNPDVFRDKTILLPCDDPESSNFTKYFLKNFAEFGLRKLISTSYGQPRGKVLTVENPDLDNLEWEYLEGNGDFRGDEVTRLRDEADIIITNPPFSLIREILSWIMEGNKQFVILGTINVIGYKDVFPLIKDNKIWLGATSRNKIMAFRLPPDQQVAKANKKIAERMGFFGNYTIVNGCCWFTNIEHGRRPQPLALKTMAENLQYSKHKKIRGAAEYPRYDNFEALEIPFSDAIPSDYEGVMGVPLSFMAHYDPARFEILGFSGKMHLKVNGKITYKRIFIRHRRDGQ